MNSAEELDNTHILITDRLEQWRHLSFALYWLFNPLTFKYTPIQPPESKKIGDSRGSVCSKSFTKVTLC